MLFVFMIRYLLFALIFILFFLFCFFYFVLTVNSLCHIYFAAHYSLAVWNVQSHSGASNAESHQEPSQPANEGSLSWDVHVESMCAVCIVTWIAGFVGALYKQWAL